MRRYLVRGIMVLGSLLTSSLALAADDGFSAVGMAKISAGIAIGLGAFGAATGQGRAAAGAVEGIARNPTSRADVFVPLIISLAFMEFQALLSFIVAFLLLG